MRSLSLALRGIWWRRWASLPILVVAVACAAVAATGPAYATNAREAVLTASLRSAPTDARGTGITTTLALDSTVTTRSFRRQADDAFLDLVAAGFAHAPITSVEDGQSAFRPTGPPVPIADLSLVDRPDACRHVTLRAGRCLRESDPFGVLITTQTAAARGWQVGTRVRVGGVDTFKQDVRVAGIYTPDAPSGRYWLDATHHYFGQVAGFATSKVPRTDAVLVPAAFFGEHPPSTGDNAVSISDVTIRVDRIDLGSLARFEAMAASAVTEVQTPLGTVQTSPELVTDLRPTITAARDATDFVTFPILVIAIQLTILTWLVLYLVLVGSAEGRTSEVVLGKLRGLTPRQTVLHALLEPLLLIVVAVPVGVVVSDALLRAAAPTLFGDSVRFAFPPAAWLAAIGAGLGGVIASVLAGVALLRRSVVEQWRRAERRPRRAGRALDAVVVALAVAGFLDLAAAPSAEAAADRNLQFVASAAPSLLAIAGALLAVRIMPLAAGTVLGRSPAHDTSPASWPSARSAGVPVSCGSSCC